ncbi:MAG: hypothetical protein EHM45_02210 [Desulfobacteraceae bacterium]|nr:MAG: hypothetical protein EHM45_02210 [Desulfobacteraceae bacterium]
MFAPQKNTEEVCCGSPAGPPSSPFERPGYSVCPFVDRFKATTLGSVAVLKTHLSFQDRLGALMVRLDIGRNQYKVAPGLYAVGDPDANAPVLVTANYKLTLDSVRKELSAVNAWILVLDTRGINVWCAAGKGTFGTAEVIRQVKNVRLDQVVGHKKLILPQLGATGVSGLQIKKECGFEVIWGPVRAQDIPAFLANRQKASSAMRRVTFNLRERWVLTGVEITQTFKNLAWIIPALFILSGFGPGIFSLFQVWHRGSITVAAVLAGIWSGAFLTPLLLPWIPGRAFALKGGLMGLLFGVVLTLLFLKPVFSLSVLSLFLMGLPVSSYLAMNFTGCTPYTSPSGVEKEMRTAIPLQSLLVLAGLVLWIVSGFL